MSGTYLASVLLEYPTGIFADKYGRKLSLLIASMIYIISLVVDVTAYSTLQFFIGAFLTGASWAFTSGAKEALIYDTLKERKLEKFNSKVLGSLDAIGAVGGIIAALIGSWVFRINETLPYWLSIGTSGLAFIFLFWIKEPKYKEEGQIIEVFKQFKEGLKLSLKNPVLQSLFLLCVPLFFFEEAWYNAHQPILVGLGLPVILLGAYQAVKTIIMAIAGIALPKLLDKFNHKVLLITIIFLEAVTWIILGTHSLHAIIIFSYILLLIHMLWNYVDADIIHDHIKSHVRATTLSARQMLISIIWIFNPWFMGYLMNTFSRTTLFPIFGLIVLLVGMTLFLSRKKHF